MFGRIKERLFGSSRARGGDLARDAGSLPQFAAAGRRSDAKSMGDTLLSDGKLDEAAVSYRQAIAENPQDADAYLNLGFILNEQQDFAAAEQSLKQALALKPESADANYLLGVLAKARDCLDDAVGYFTHALELKPDFEHIYSDLCQLLSQSGQSARAKALLQKGIALYPGRADLLASLGNLHAAENELDPAICCYQKALTIQPDASFLYNSLGVVCEKSGRNEEAIAHYERALQLKPGAADVLFNRGNVLLRLGRAEEALSSYDNSLLIESHDIDVWCNRGNALRQLNRSEEALASFYRMLQLNPGSADAFSNIGAVLADLHRYGEALASFELALQSQPDHIEAHFFACSCRLLLGDFESGWKEYEWRWQMRGQVTGMRRFDQPLWLGGASLQGKTILLHAEQGLGDTIQFSRYAKLVAAKGATVFLETQAGLAELLSEIEGVSRVIGKGEPLPSFDYHCPLLSLPLAFNTGLATIPADFSYLSCASSGFDEWRNRLGEKTKPRVGLVWSGSTVHVNDRNRSVALEMMLKLVSDRLSYVCLQKEIRKSDLDVLQDHREIRCFCDDLVSFSDTAALVAHMDLVISVDTSVAHLAGAMGKPVWLLLPHNPDWRWLLEQSDSPWYPSARLFRQPAIGDWNSVISTVAGELDALYPSHE